MTDILKQKTKTVAIYKNSNYVLAFFIFICLVLYVYFANVAVRALTTLEKTKQGMQSLSIEISEMESKRFVIDNNVNPILARNLGFIEVNHPNFIIKNSRKATLSLKTD